MGREPSLISHLASVDVKQNGPGGRGRKSEGSTADTARKRPERPWTAARTMEVSPRHCAATSALRNCCFNCRAWQSHKDVVVVVDRFYISLLRFRADSLRSFRT